ncbi:MCE family protein [Mycobacterium sp.]|uniref:MCE family protein n=1 Tax=Mycobacterium sp. TaxID=1785 RepID=UPI003D0BC788
MRLNRRTLIQLAIFSVIALAGVGIMAFGYIRLPAMFGIGQYKVTIELPRSGGLYPRGNVTYRGTQVGKVESVDLADDGKVEAVLSLNSGIDIPSNLSAEVHSQTAIGEQYVALLPRDATSPPLKNGDVVPMTHTSVPPDIDKLLDAANRGLQAIPRDNLKTAVDEAYVAFGGLGPELSRLIRGATTLGIDARANLDSLTTLIDQSAPVLNTQTDTADSIQAWASNLATVTNELRGNDTALAGLIEKGAPAADQARQLLERLQPSLPVVLANLVSIDKVAIAYQPGLEQLLVLVPQGIANVQAGTVASRDTTLPFRAQFLDFNLGLNLPPPCQTGFLPASQRRTPSQVDTPERVAGDVYCRIPQDSPFDVRGARNIPCETVPGKRAPTVKMCESNEQYVPLNDGFFWKGDPNATYSGQAVPQLPPGSPPTQGVPAAPPPPLAVAEYDPASGSYIGPDGKVYTQTDLSANAPKEKSWQDMLMPPKQN